MPRGINNDEAVKARRERLGEVIKTKRLSIGWSMTILGAKLNVSHQQIAKYEQGIDKVDAIKLEDLCEFFKCPMSDFYENMRVDVDIEQSRAMMDHMKVFNSLDKSGKVKATRLVRSLQEGVPELNVEMYGMELLKKKLDYLLRKKDRDGALIFGADIYEELRYMCLDDSLRN